MDRALIIEHDHLSPPGPVADRLRERGYAITELVIVPPERFDDPLVEACFPEPSEWDLLVVMGAPWSVDDHERIGSWILPELEMLRGAQRIGVPVLGICFGGQALASALGGSVERAPRPEIGWTTVRTDDPDLVAEGPWFQFHYDRWQLPPGAVEIARNHVASQAFRLGRSLAVQFHPEMTPPCLQLWLDNGGDAEVRSVGLSATTLLEETRREGLSAQQRARRLVDAFLDNVACAR